MNSEAGSAALRTIHARLWRRYKNYGTREGFAVSVLAAVSLFFASIVTNYIASSYATRKASNFVEDLILSNTPVYNVDGFFVYGALAIIGFAMLLLLSHPKRIPFVLYALALFYFTRAAFIVLTHLGPYPDQIAADLTSSIGIFVSQFFFGDDLFFSGHTGAPFLLALIFWRERGLRYLFLASSVGMAAVVLLGHIHYSIDVASAFFITYGVYHIACHLFSAEHRLFLEDEAESI